MSKLDLARCLRALKNIRVEGSPTSSERKTAISDAIILIQEKGKAALISEYIGVKNYAHFGDQREDHRYGCCPRHGSIVFRIGRVGRIDSSQEFAELGADEIYLLECVRDFPPIKDPYFHENNRERFMNLCDVLETLKQVEERVSFFRNCLLSAEVDSEQERAEKRASVVI
jgi:hypothetical protein